jgi:hypothetical protein
MVAVNMTTKRIFSEEHRRKLSEASKGKDYYGNKNPFYGKKHSEESKKKIGISAKIRNQGRNNPAWKGDNITYSGLHQWIRLHLSKPEKCSLCNERESTEVACITGIYNRELRNWAWLCRKCHLEWDNIHERHKIARITKTNNRTVIR